jgi:hypothetical protein
MTLSQGTEKWPGREGVPMITGGSRGGQGGLSFYVRAKGQR